MKLHRFPTLVLLGIGLWGLTLGCSGPPTPPPSPDAAENLRKIAMAYNQFVSTNKRPPRNLEQFQPVLKQFGAPDAVLRSPGDGELYVIIWGVTDFGQLNPSSPVTPRVLAYERKGVNGKRFVAMTMGNVVEMSDEEFTKASFPVGHKVQ